MSSRRIPQCTVLGSFFKIWDLGLQRRMTRNGQLGLEESTGNAMLNLRGELLQAITKYSTALSYSLNRRIESIRSKEANELQKFEAAFVLSYYEEDCPQECLRALLDISSRLKWVSAVYRAYYTAKRQLREAEVNSKLVRALLIHVEKMEKKYSEELADLRYLCPRLLELCSDIFYHFEALPSVKLSCTG